ncbi:MFS transporter [Paenibacillus sp. UMB4589-SE434]|uniref:MFS transporter n=1 Tax=Paenibacillus sp. UMB4589-SE434 TaxID=3046314 RepID=UPI00254F0127|nr:MFS transporter [Paenibacillus sp. UMB4589-SE434]MDK8179651.1 MFS transporter [Paenibacillus sp. UMB4589-SE434]
MKLRVILYLIGFSAFIASLGQNLYNPLLLQVQAELHTTSYLVSLSVSLFTLALAVMQIVFGPLADTKGRKAVLIPSLVLYIIASIGCAYAPTIGYLLFFRVLQGVGAAAVPVVAAAIIGDLFRGKQLSQGMATYQLLLMLAPAIGPLVGGVIGEQYGYGATFLLLAAISLMLLIANFILLPETKPAFTHSKQSNTQHFSLIFKNPVSLVILLFGFFQFMVYFIYLTFVPQILNNTYLFQPAKTGVILLMMSCSTIISIKLGGWMLHRIGARKSLVYGFALHALSVILFAFTAQLSLSFLILDVCLFGFFMGLTGSIPTTLLTELFPEERATAIGVYNFIRYLGMAAGPMIGVLLYAGSSIMPLFLTCGFAFGAAIFWGARLITKSSSKIGNVVLDAEH